MTTQRAVCSSKARLWRTRPARGTARTHGASRAHPGCGSPPARGNRYLDRAPHPLPHPGGAGPRDGSAPRPDGGRRMRRGRTGAGQRPGRRGQVPAGAGARGSGASPGAHRAPRPGDPVRGARPVPAALRRTAPHLTVEPGGGSAPARVRGSAGPPRAAMGFGPRRGARTVAGRGGRSPAAPAPHHGRAHRLPC